MEIVAAADSDERGLSLLKVVTVLQKVAVFVHSFTINKLRKHTSQISSTADTSTMPDMREEDISTKFMLVKQVIEALDKLLSGVNSR
ncbi:hypothetical protein Pmani_037053 [Petrolisthes manimaculis]|uniref:Uncharacterized protein n=1 Tax=Petrolisthes manimaculis TaxID=1843537 RepID=A0AAE1NH51_9EUCA|nr:hypothetical protein Pmani_037053 [Petrolisthes manimaculis]